MNLRPPLVALIAALTATLLAYWVGGENSVVWAILFIGALAWYVYKAMAVLVHGQAPGVNPLVNGPYVWLVISALVIIIMIAAWRGRYVVEREAGAIITPAMANQHIVDYAEEIARLEGLTADQRQEINDLVPDILDPGASLADCQAAEGKLQEAAVLLGHYVLQNKRAKALAVATVRQGEHCEVYWQGLYKAEVKKNTLQADEQIRRQAHAQGGSLPYVVKEIGHNDSLTFNPARQTGVWYVGLPLSGITAKDKEKGFHGHFENFVKSEGRRQAQFEIACTPNSTNDKVWFDLTPGGTFFTDPSYGDFGVFVRWKKGVAIPDEAFTITSQYVLREWPISWQVRIKNLPPSDRNNRKAVPVTVVPTTITGLPGKRIDSLVCITITGSNGQVIPVSGEVWFGSTSKLITKSFDNLSTIGEDNPALAIEHFCAEPVNVDITFLPRTTSSL